jgi:hypothetical protein
MEPTKQVRACVMCKQQLQVVTFGEIDFWLRPKKPAFVCVAADEGPNYVCGPTCAAAFEARLESPLAGMERRVTMTALPPADEDFSSPRTFAEIAKDAGAEPEYVTSEGFTRLPPDMLEEIGAGHIGWNRNAAGRWEVWSRKDFLAQLAEHAAAEAGAALASGVACGARALGDGLACLKPRGHVPIDAHDWDAQREARRCLRPYAAPVLRELKPKESAIDAAKVAAFERLGLR